jgi:hypothetical protein
MTITFTYRAVPYWEQVQDNAGLVDDFLNQYFAAGLRLKGGRRAQAPYWIWDPMEGRPWAEVKPYIERLKAELRQDALLALEGAIKTWDPQKGELSTWYGYKFADAVDRAIKVYRRVGRHEDAKGRPLNILESAPGRRKNKLGTFDSILILREASDSDVPPSDAEDGRPEAGPAGLEVEVTSSASEPAPQSRAPDEASGLKEAAVRRLALSPKAFASHLETSGKPSPELLAEAIAYIRHESHELYWEQWAYFEARRLLGKWARSCKELTPKQRQLGDNLRKWTERELKELKRRTN